jgi:acid phosphatase type 7
MVRRGLAFAVASVALVASFGVAAPPAPASSSIRIAAVGDIACKNRPGNNRKVCQYDDVAAAIARRDYDRFLVLGDVQYEYGEYQNFVDNYDRYFGRLLPISEPVPGNHDYGTRNAHGYYRYFDRIGHPPDGYYSFDLGGWHIIALNSAICPAVTGCGPGDPQYEWLQQDLASSDAPCTLAYWHHPRWDWLKYQNADWTEDYEWFRSKPFWDLLAAADADVVLSGHNHNYSRWKPMDANGHADPNGIRQFIVGSGGRNLNGFGSKSTKPSTFATGWAGGFGFLQLTLHPTSYDWRFMPADGQPSFVDEGNGSCH